jgi:hypothetical protein
LSGPSATTSVVLGKLSTPLTSTKIDPTALEFSTPSTTSKTKSRKSKNKKPKRKRKKSTNESPLPPLKSSQKPSPTSETNSEAKWLIIWFRITSYPKRNSIPKGD